MASPSTPILDDFNRGNAALNSGNWVGPVVNDAGPLTILTNQVTGVNIGLTSSSAWATPLGPDCETYITVPTRWDVGNELQVFARLSSTGATFNAYSCQITDDNAWTIYRWDASSPTQIGVGSHTLVGGEGVWFSVVGSAIKVYSLSGGVGTLIASATDSTYGAAGFVAWEVADETVRLDDFGGGTLFAPPPRLNFSLIPKLRLRANRRLS